MDLHTRKVAIGLLFGLLVVSAGCSGLFADEATTSELLVVNQDETDHSVVVEIVEDGNLVYSDGRTLGAESQLNMARFNRTGEFEMKITVDGNSTTLSHTFGEDSDPPDVTNIGIDNDGKVTVE
ncbi:hypothetical protein [Halodesulfurarchaeum sp.]|uniref:hypothetical protein n=1 Tax=Halodesulfurarchaeum sp. TaxID=1980530 RepID=UPI002FC2F309